MPRRKNNAPTKNAEERTTTPSTDDLLTIHEVARYLRVDDTTVRRWINNQTLEAVTLPHLGKRRGYRVKKATLDRLLSSPALASSLAEE